MGAIVDDQVEDGALHVDQTLGFVRISVPDYHVNPGIIVLQIATSQIDITADDGRSGFEILRPDRQRPSILDANFQKSNRPGAIWIEDLIINGYVERPFVRYFPMII